MNIRSDALPSVVDIQFGGLVNNNDMRLALNQVAAALPPNADEKNASEGSIPHLFFTFFLCSFAFSQSSLFSLNFAF